MIMATFTPFIEQIMNNFLGFQHFSNVQSLIAGISYIIAILFFIKCAFKLRNHHKAKNQKETGVPVLYLAASVCFFALPNFITAV